MNFQFYVEKLKSFDKYEEFIKKHKKAFACSGFFVRDLVGSDNQQHFDFLTEEKKVVSFQLEKNEMTNLDDFIGKLSVEKIDLEMDFDFDEIGKLIEDKMKKENITNKVQKYLFSFQKKDGKNYLLGTVFISMMGMLKVNINLDEMKIDEFEKRSFFDMMRIVKKGE